MIRTSLTVLAIAAAFALGFALRGGGRETTDTIHAHGSEEPVVWTCSMHPQFQLPESGECPICFMDLIPLADQAVEGLGPRDLVLSENAAALAEITTAPVERRFAAREVQLVGRVAADETRQRVITARIPGRLERLHVDYTGRTVTRGEKLADIYSPDLYRARAELLAAQAAVERGEPGATANLASVKERLRLWDLDPEQVASTGGDRITITAPAAGTVVRKDALEGAYVKTGAPLFAIADLSRVWVELEAYERDLLWLVPGQQASFSVTALPGETFTGEVLFVDPVLDARTRTVRVRLEADNMGGRLLPGMLARGRVQAELANDGRPRAGRADAEPPLVIPATAPLLTGERAVVYRREPGDEPRFQGIEIDLGHRAGDFYLVHKGLDEGDEVVVHGAFKLDSALQIQAKPSMMLPEETIEVPDIPSCFAGMAGGVVDAYLVLQAALAGDDEAAAKQAAANLRGTFSLHCLEAIPDLVSASSAVSTAEDMDSMRVAFQPLSDLLWSYVDAVGWEGDQPLRRFHCSMAFDNKGAHWLQKDTTTANPYYGAMMLRCGGEVAMLDGGEATE